MTRFDTIEQAVAEIAAGRAVVVVDDEDRENEGDLIFAAEMATPELMAFMVRHTSGFICAPLTEADCDRLDLPPMYHTNQDRRGTAYTVTRGRPGGRHHRHLGGRPRRTRSGCSPTRPPRPPTCPRPGHVVPLRASDGRRAAPPRPHRGRGRPGPAGRAAPGRRALRARQTTTATWPRLPELRAFADEHGLRLITIADLIAYRRRNEKQVERVAEARRPTAHGEFRAVGYRALLDGIEHIALVFGDLGDGEDVLVRVHSECLTGDVFGSLRCDCGPQLRRRPAPGRARRAAASCSTCAGTRAAASA